MLGLSHWPDGGVPDAFAADTSAEIVVRYLQRDHDGPEVDTVTNNHFDEDGMLASWLLLARPARELWSAAIAAAEAGDFHTWTDPRAAWTAMAIMAAAERPTSPFPDVLRALNRAGATDPAGTVTLALLPHMESMVTEPERFARLWEPRWRRVEDDRAAIAAGAATVTEIPGGNLAVVEAAGPLDPFAVLPGVEAMRVLWATDDGHLRLEHRYETWVRYASRPLPPRRDLTPLTRMLNDVETASGRWVFEGVTMPAARLAFVDAAGRATRSELTVDAVVSAIRAFDTLGG